MADGGPRRFLFTGGGTGGHVAPALAIAEEIRRRHPQARFLYVGVAGKAEASMVPRAWEADIAAGRARLKFAPSRGYPGTSDPVALLRFAMALLLGCLKATLVLLMFRPQVIVATGGYVSAPSLFAAFGLRKLRLLRPRIFVHEQNAVLGRLNKLAAGFADQVGVAFPGTSVDPRKKAYVGYPVRGSVVGSALGPGARAEAREKLGLPGDARVVFAFGGSQGARTINRGVVDALPALLADPSVHVIHGTGKRLAGNPYDGAVDSQRRLAGLEGLPDDWQERYHPKDFFFDMASNYAAADVVICRGGAGSLAEVCANGVAAVAIPKANLPGDHQAFNANVLRRAGAAELVFERVDLRGDEAVESVDVDQLAQVVLGLLRDPKRRSAMVKAGKALHRPETLELIGLLIAALTGQGDAPKLLEPPEPEQDRILGLDSGRLEALLGRVARGVETLNEDERRTALYKIDGYLASAGYVLPARGCRMVGRGRFDQRADVLASFATGRSGGRYTMLPIVRRDAFRGLGWLGLRDPLVLEALARGIEDPYFEARAEAVVAVTTLARGAEPGIFEELLGPLTRCTSDGSFEVRQGALRALGEIATSFDQVSGAFHDRRFDSNWQVRTAMIEALSRLTGRGVIDEATASVEGHSILRTSDGYRIIFRLKQAFNELPGRDAATDKEA